MHKHLFPPSFVRYSASLVLAAATLLLSISSTRAYPLAGTTQIDPGQTVIPGVVPAGGAGVLIASGVFNSIGGTATDTLRQAVYREASGTLDFYFQLTNTDSVSSISQFVSILNFSAYVTSVGVVPSPPSGAGFMAGTTQVTTVARAVDGSNLFFNFAPGFGPFTTSTVFVISTNATNFNALGVYTVVGSPGQYGGFSNAFAPTGPGVPVASAPESGTNALLLCVGLGGLLLAHRAFGGRKPA